MAVTAISYDWGVEPTIIRMTVTDTLAQLTTTGYWAASDTVSEVEALNNGSFEVPEGSLFLINYSDGDGFFVLDTDDDSFVAEADPGSLSDTLADGDIFIGSVANVATAQTMSGDATIIADGTLTIADDAVTTVKILDLNVTTEKLEADAVTNAKLADDAVSLENLDAGITPSHIVVFAGEEQTTGGSASEAFTVTGALETDLVFVQMIADGTNSVTVLEASITAADTLTVVFSGDPAADTDFAYQVLRAAA